jgi:hypothetical protein
LGPAVIGMTAGLSRLIYMNITDNLRLIIRADNHPGLVPKPACGYIKR